MSCLFISNLDICSIAADGRGDVLPVGRVVKQSDICVLCDVVAAGLRLHGAGHRDNILHKWRFKGAWLAGNYYIHHGFLYAAKMSPLLLVNFLGTPREGISWENELRILLCAGA